MAGLKKILLIQMLLLILISCLGSYLIVTNFQNFVVKQQLKTQRAVSLYIRNHPEQVESPEHAKQIQQIFNLNSLYVRTEDRKTIFSQPANLNYLPPITNMLLDSTNFIRPQFAVNSKTKSKFEFTVTLDDASNLLQTSLIWFILIVLVLILVPLTIVKMVIHQASTKVAEAMSTMVDDLIHKDAEHAQLENDNANGITSSIFPSIVRLNTFLRKKQKEIENSAFQIKQDAYKDSVTELGNRNMFVEFYEQHIENNDKVGFGSLALIRCSELQLINQTRGYQKGDEYIKDVANLITKSIGTYSGSHCYRINSSDFAIILPHITLKESEKFADSLQSLFTEYQQRTELGSVANTGIVAYGTNKPLGELLALVDTALSIAQSKQSNAWHIQKDTDVLNNVSASFGNQNWRQVIEDVLDNSRIQLMAQTITPTNRSTKTYAEVLARFKTKEDQVLPTASFLAMAEKLEQISHVDRMIIESAIDIIKTKNLSEQFFGLNITSNSAHDEQFLIWLERKLLKEGTIAAKLIFEVSEFGLQQNVNASKRFIDMIHRVGARITVERFGVGLTSFKFFRDLKPDFIKMDASYTRGLEEDKNNQYFMRLIVDLAHRIGVTVLAEGVETQEEKHIVEQLCLDGAQGYYIEKPKLI